MKQLSFFKHSVDRSHSPIIADNTGASMTKRLLQKRKELVTLDQSHKVFLVKYH
jgi:hypothetical protein